MEKLRQKFYKKYQLTETNTVRYFINTIDWNDRFIGIRGSRGVGKTTLILQYLKLNYKPDNQSLYISLDDFYFVENRLYNIADEFYKKGGKILALDEVHRYKNWAIELKNIYDDFPDLKVLFTGSSLLHLRKAKADLSRRAVMYHMPGLSFREFLTFETKKRFPVYSFNQIIENHTEIALEITSQVKPLQYFDDYLNFGYYPFYTENRKTFHNRLEEILHTVFEVDIPQFEEIKTSNIVYLKKLAKVLSNSVPFKPNFSALSQRTGISINTLKSYMKSLSDSNVFSNLYFEDVGINSLNKPEKIYMENTNLMYNLSDNFPETGNLRETFFYNQVKQNSKVYASKQSDFFVNGVYTMEVGGKNKGKKQISDIENAFIVKDLIEIGNENTIPLWLFGFTY